MSKISYFQKYSQKENHITNNTLLMFRHIYRDNPTKFEKLLELIISDPNKKFDIGMVFEQQVSEKHSIPDAYIKQNPISIYLEAKSDGKLYKDQIERHVKSIKEKNDNNNNIIIGLVRDAVNNADLEEFKKTCGQIHFVVTTYTEILDIIKTQIYAPYEANLLEIIEDYEEFLRSTNMLYTPFEMLAYASGQTWKGNIKYGIYYELASENSKAHIPYFGLYKDKEITHIGKIKATVIYSNKTNKIEYGKVDNQDIENIKEIIKISPYEALSDTDHRYYILETLQNDPSDLGEFAVNNKVQILKTSAGGIRKYRYLNLQTISEDTLHKDDKLQTIIYKLNGKHFD